MEHNSPLPKRNIFIVPEGYFEQMEGLVKEKVKRPTAATVSPFTWNRLTPIGVVAAIILIGLFIRPTSSPTGSPEELLADVSEEQLSLYLSINESPGTESITSTSDNLDEIEQEYLFINETDSFINLN